MAWLVALLAMIGGVVAYYTSQSQLDRERQTHTKVAAQLAEMSKQLEVLRTERDKLSSTAKEAEAALAAMHKTQDELQERLKAEVAKGDILISQQQGDLVVDLLDKVVFDSGQAELNDKGKQVLREVGETLGKVPDKTIQVSGHTDSQPISDKLKERFPTNWELSTARATNVVRYLVDEIHVPAERLAAAGYAEFRPIASNASSDGRRRNRRIEVRLLPLPEPRKP